MGRSKHSDDEGGLWASIKNTLGLNPIKPTGSASEREVQNIKKEQGVLKNVTKRKSKY